MKDCNKCELLCCNSCVNSKGAYTNDDKFITASAVTDYVRGNATTNSANHMADAARYAIADKLFSPSLRSVLSDNINVSEPRPTEISNRMAVNDYMEQVYRRNLQW